MEKISALGARSQPRWGERLECDHGGWLGGPVQSPTRIGSSVVEGGWLLAQARSPNCYTFPLTGQIGSWAGRLRLLVANPTLYLYGIYRS